MRAGTVTPSTLILYQHKQVLDSNNQRHNSPATMELMSSSEDEGDSPTSLSTASPSRPKPPPAAGSQDSLEDELLSPTTRTKVSSSSAERRKVRDQPVGHKPVISARELLLNFLPASKRKQQAASPAKSAKVAAVDAAVAAYSLVTPKKAAPAAPRAEQKEERELTASERIARKYGLAAAKTASKDAPTRDRSASSSSTASRPTAASRSIGSGGGATPRKEAAASPVQQPVEKSKKRSFWDAQTAGVDSEQPAQKPTYVSPFSDPNGFMNMKKRRQRRQQPTEEMSEEEMKSARDAFYDDSKSKAQDVGPRPRHIIGSAIPELDDADDWMSDSKEMVSDDEEVARKVVAAVDTETLPSPRRAGVTLSRQTTREKRAPSKRPTRKRLPKEESDSSEDEKEAYTSERWPQLDPPTVRSPHFYLSCTTTLSNVLLSVWSG